MEGWCIGWDDEECQKCAEWENCNINTIVMTTATITRPLMMTTTARSIKGIYDDQEDTYTHLLSDAQAM